MCHKTEESSIWRQLTLFSWSAVEQSGTKQSPELTARSNTSTTDRHPFPFLCTAASRTPSRRGNLRQVSSLRHRPRLPHAPGRQIFLVVPPDRLTRSTQWRAPFHADRDPTFRLPRRCCGAGGSMVLSLQGNP